MVSSPVSYICSHVPHSHARTHTHIPLWSLDGCSGCSQRWRASSLHLQPAAAGGGSSLHRYTPAWGSTSCPRRTSHTQTWGQPSGTYHSCPAALGTCRDELVERQKRVGETQIQYELSWNLHVFCHCAATEIVPGIDAFYNAFQFNSILFVSCQIIIYIISRHFTYHGVGQTQEHVQCKTETTERQGRHRKSFLPVAIQLLPLSVTLSQPTGLIAMPAIPDTSMFALNTQCTECTYFIFYF